MRNFFIVSVFLLSLLCSCDKADSNNCTVVISLDAFRWDYPDIYETPWLDSIAAVGVKATMLPSFPASTFPNHYTIATGLVPDHNGIVNSSFWDTETQVLYSMVDPVSRNVPEYYKGEPIWTTAEKQGVRTATLYWVGSDIPIKGSLPSSHLNWYDEPRLTYEERIYETLRLVSLPESERPRLVMTYFDDPDMVSHHFGPISPETGAMVHFLDSLIGILYTGVQMLPDKGKINIIVTADHGMTDISADRYICMDDYVKSEWYTRAIGTNPTSIFSVEGCRDSIVCALSGVEHIYVWKKEEIPSELNYGTSDRIGDIIVAPENGWQFSRGERGAKGAHGYFPSYPDMQVSFRACGPDFKQGYVCPTKFINIDIYPMIAKILGIKPEPVDGKLERIDGILR